MSDGRRPNSVLRAGRASSLLPLALVLLAGALALTAHAARGPQEQGRTRVPKPQSSCERCHTGIEEMHPEAELSCVDCHGGDPTANDKLLAHVQPQRGDIDDERVPPLNEDLAYRRFKNPMDLRIVDRTCGQCHADMVRHLESSLHGTTAGHLSDGFYEVGLIEEKTSPFGIFSVWPFQADGGSRKKLIQIPRYKRSADRYALSTHFTDLARKECMQCHLWSQGRAVEGRVGFDGDYRGEGCAACHVPYAVDGLTESRDRQAVRNEPGHPLTHTMTRTPPTETCTTCHYGDASIGLHFRGLSQLPPGAPGGPDIPGTTKAPLNRTFYIQDAELTPPDVHHQSGMHCVDCHTLSDVMGDGNLYQKMEEAVEISCESCHGDFERVSNLKTERGRPLSHLFKRGEEVWMRSKVTGAEHKIPQALHVLTPGRPEYNAAAAEAMKPEHAELECYTCHAGWNINFLGFHFDRNESLTQLDLISGLKTPGRVTTQEKVFTTWKSFYAGRNESGRIAPYLTGFSTMGSVWDEDGEKILDQVMPETAEGLSGLTMIHHQLHSTRPTARSCIECHRTSATWGMGSANFRLARQLAFVADRRGIEVIAITRGSLPTSVPLTKIVLPDVIDIEILADPVQGHAQYVFAAEGGRGVHVIDVRRPEAPKRVAFVDSISPREMTLAGSHLYVADGIGGLRIYDVSQPEEIRLAGRADMFDAHDVFVQWPYAYVADGPGGLAIVDVRAPIAPRIVGGMATNPNPNVSSAAGNVEVLFQYSRPLADDDGNPIDRRRPARNLAAVMDESLGLVLFDVTEPTHPKRLFPRPRESRAQRDLSYRGLVLKSHVDLASPQGGTKTTERDYAYTVVERTLGNGQSVSALAVLDVTDPTRPRRVGDTDAGAATEMLTSADFYNQPFLQNVAFVPGQDGVRAIDVSLSTEPADLGVLQAIRNAYVVAVEEFPLDKMVDEDGRRLKDVSHPESRWLYRSEIERVLAVDGETLGTIAPGEEPEPWPGRTARLHMKRFDLDRSGFLEGEEFLMGRGPVADIDQDGRVSLEELARSAASFGMAPATATPPEVDSPFLGQRTGVNGDLARLLDGVNPYEFDRDDDRRLSRSEMTRAFFAALDLNGDGRLSYAELSRHPGDLRQLRYRDRAALEAFEDLDFTGDGVLGPREFKLQDRDMQALDVDGDGEVQLRVEVTPWERERGLLGPQTEWPTRQPFFVALPPVLTLEQLLATFDGDDDGRLSQRELRRRPDLFADLDGDGNAHVDPYELTRVLGAIARDGVEVVVDGFLERWDIDRDGRVSRSELPQNARLPLRLRHLAGGDR